MTRDAGTPAPRGLEARAADSSVLVAAFASWHPGHASATAALTDDVAVAEHTVVETYSVLTRLPPPHRIAPGTAAQWLRRRISTRVIRPASGTVAALPTVCAAHDISGGAVYDALIAVTARDSGRTVLTRDERAARTYRRLDVAYELLP